MAVSPVSSSSPGAAAATQDPGTWVVQPGDTLSRIARQLQGAGLEGTTAELVRTLARLNGLANPDRVAVGQVLVLPTRASRPSDPDVVARAVPGPLQEFRLHVGEQRTRLETALLGLLRRVPAEPAPESATAETPRFRQSDPAWRTERLGVSGEGPTLAQAGCAVTACAMALSRLGGTVLTPGALLRHLRDAGGFQGPLLDWSVAGTAIRQGPCATPGSLDCAQLDRELDAGRPVLLRVVHEVQGRSRQHWVCLTGHGPGPGQYLANDPATGGTTVLTRKDGALASGEAEPVRYASDGRMVTFAPAEGQR